MFTGIIMATGRIASVQALGAEPEAGVRLNINAGSLSMDDVAIGDSIALNGTCLTVVEKTGNGFVVEVSRETLNCTTGLNGTNEVNLEKALSLGDRLGGHLVSGHVDGIGTIRKFEPVGESWELVVEAPRELAKYFAYKGSVSVNGISLTVNQVEDTKTGCLFSINLIPHTIEVTTLKDITVGAKVNLEIDLIARYVERMLSAPDQA